MRKRHLFVALATALTLSFSMTAFGATAVSGGYWSDDDSYVTSEGETLTSGLYDITDSWGDTYTYYFDSDGNYVTGWQDIGGKSYYFGYNGKAYKNEVAVRYFDNGIFSGSNSYYLGEDGAVVTTPGWKLVDGYWYYITSDGGALATSKETIGGVDYYFDGSGCMVASRAYYIYNEATGQQEMRLFDETGAMVKDKTGWVICDGKWFYLYADSTVRIGWFYENGKYYYLGDWGIFTGTLWVDGVLYLFDDAGVMQAGGWKQYKDKWYYAEASGALKTGWYNEGSKWYYFETHNGFMYDSGTQWIDGDCYLFDDAGVMKSGGWVLYNKRWYYAEASGVLKTGWFEESGKWYYLDDYYGAYASGTHGVYNSTTYEYDLYLFDDAGVMQTGWTFYDGEWYYADGLGVLKTGWVSDGGYWYYFDDDGEMVTGSRSIYNNATEEYDYYYFKPNGQMVTGWYNAANAYAKNPSWVYTQADGKVKKGWVSSGGSWYYIDYDGFAKKDESLVEYIDASGNITTDSYDYELDQSNTFYNRYYFGKDSAMITGWYQYEDSYTGYSRTYWLYAQADGTIKEGWATSGGKWYYISSTGRMYEEEFYSEYIDKNGNITDEEYDDEGNANELYRRYYFDETGAMITGWYHEVDESYGYYWDRWIYAQADGAIKEGWVLDGGKWYYVNSYGVMQRDTATPTIKYPTVKYPDSDDYKDEDGFVDWEEYDKAWDKANEEFDRLYEEYLASTCIFDKNGVMVTGWYEVKTSSGSTWYYADANGKAHNGWLASGGKWYYFEYGRMLTNTFTEDGYYVGADGTMQ